MPIPPIFSTTGYNRRTDMPQKHVVAEGEGISKISEQYGFAPATVWNAPENQALREKREDPNILFPGDVLVIPDKQPKTLTRETGKRHRFRKVDVPPMFELQLLNAGQPRAQIAYTLTVDGKKLQGTTDDEGMVRQFIPAKSQSGTLEFTDQGETHKLEIDFGGMDPLTEIKGVQKRLNNLGFPCGTPDGTLNARTQQALQMFQAVCGLPSTGALDEATLDQLKQLHDTPSTFPDDGDGEE